MPEIRSLEDESSDFHDSSLLSLTYDPRREMVRVALSTPDAGGVTRLWEVQLAGVLKIDLESLGDGLIDRADAPPEIYDVYSDERGAERSRWVQHLHDTGAPDPEGIHCITFASSYLRGWGERESVEGIRVICRRWSVVPAPKQFSGMEFSRKFRAADRSSTASDRLDDAGDERSHRLGVRGRQEPEAD